MSIDCKRGNVVLDAAGFFAGVELSEGVFYATEEVLSEVMDAESRLKLELALASGKLVVLRPPKEHTLRVVSKARELGILGELSGADISILALADLVRSACGSSILYTDDKVVQDVALALGVRVRGVKYPERSKPRSYTYRCESCGYSSRSPGSCPRCGTPLRLLEALR